MSDLSRFAEAHGDLTLHEASAAYDAVMAERERCAKIAGGNWMPHSNALGSEYILRHRLAEKIRSGNA